MGQVGGGLGPWNTGVPSLFSGTNGRPDGKIGAVSRGGRFEWANVRLDGVASTTVTLTLTNDLVDADGGVADPDLDHLVSLMRHVFENRAEARSVGAAAAREAARWTWAMTITTG